MNKGIKLSTLGPIGAKFRGALREGFASKEVRGDKFWGTNKVGGHPSAMEGIMRGNTPGQSLCGRYLTHYQG